MSTRIWVVSELYFPEMTSTGHFVTGIAEGLAADFTVNVVCSQPTYSARGTRAPDSEIRAGVNIFRAYSPLLDKNVLPFRLLNLFFFTFSVFWRLLWRLRTNDVVLVVTNPPSLPYVVALACRIRRAKSILLVHDVYPEVLIATGVIRDGGVLARALKWISRKLYVSMSAIVVIGRDMERLVRHSMAGFDPKIEFIPNWADLQEIRPKPRAENSLLESLRLGDRFVVQYSGNMGRTHGLEYILYAATIMADQSDITFLMIGDGARRDWLEAQVAKKGLTNVVMLPFQDRKALCESLNCADLSIISFLPGMSGVSVPSRMYNVFAAGKPVVAVSEDGSELARIIQQQQIGWVVPPGHPELLVEALQEASRAPHRLADMGQRARLAAENLFSVEHAIAKYRALIESLQDEGLSTPCTTVSSV